MNVSTTNVPKPLGRISECEAMHPLSLAAGNHVRTSIQRSSSPHVRAKAPSNGALQMGNTAIRVPSPLDEFRSAGLCTAFPRSGEPRSNVHSTILVTQRATRAKAPSNGALQRGNTAIRVPSPLDEFRSAGLCTAFPRGGGLRSNVYSTILVTQRATRAKAPSNGALQMGNTSITFPANS
jgi:hypothetical protein